MVYHFLFLKQTLIVFFTCVCFYAQAQLVPACFILTVSPQPTGFNPRGICTADFNNDGRGDIATANAGSNDISIILSTTTGFSTAVSYTAGSAPYAITVADFNLDLLMDLAVANYSSNNVTVFMRTGGGTFTVAGTFSVGSGPTSICSGDFNFDARDDLAVCNSGGNNISVLMGYGTGSMFPAVNFTTGTQPYCIRAADLNGDYSLDLITANSGGNNISVLMGTGTGSFGTATSYSTGVQPYSLQAGDINNDTYRDIVVANVGSGDVSVLIGSASGTLASAVSYSVGSNPYSVDIADFNLDGKRDLTTANYGSSMMSVLLGTGTGSFTSPVQYTTGLNPTGVSAADFNADGKSDIAVSDFGSNTAHIYINGVPSITVTPSATICAGSSFTLSAAGTATFSWNGGPASNSIAVNPSVTTSYTVVATTAGGCSNTAVRTITAIQLPTLTVNSGTICSGQTFTITPTGAPTYTIINGYNVVWPLTTTQYSVFGINNSGCLSSSPVISTVVVNPLPTVSVNSGSVCSGNSFTIIPSGALNYTFSGGSAIVSPTVTTNYSVTGSSSLGCVSGNAVSSVSVIPIPTIVINGPSVICSGKSATLNATGALSYTWNGTTPGSSIIVSPLSNSNYTVSGINSSGCENTAVLTITVNPLPGITIAAASLSVCSGGTISLTANGANSYSWTGGISNSVPFTPTINGSYTVTGTDLNGCENTAVADITVHPLPVIVISGGNDTICNGETKQLIASGGANYSWSNGGNNATTTVSPTSTEIYSVTVSSLAGCVSTQTVIINVDQCTGFANVTRDVSVELYPNPVSGNLIVSWPGEEAIRKLEILDPQSRICMSMLIRESQSGIKLPDYPPGIYLLLVYEEGKPVLSKKFIITK
jgi:hypothetical protein